MTPLLSDAGERQGVRRVDGSGRRYGCERLRRPRDISRRAGDRSVVIERSGDTGEAAERRLLDPGPARRSVAGHGSIRALLELNRERAGDRPR